MSQVIDSEIVPSDVAAAPSTPYPPDPDPQVMLDFERNVWCLLGLPIDATTMEETRRRIDAAIVERKRCFLTTPNLNFVIASHRDADFRDSVIDSDWVIADGMPLIWVARLLGAPINERVPGSGLIEQMRFAPRENPIALYFFGGQEGVAEKACAELASERCGLIGAGAYNPGFGSVDDMSDPQIIDTINRANADLLLVSLGAKKGQAWIVRNHTALEAPVISHLGAVVNFIAGTVVRAPRWIQGLGLEWVWRIYQEHSLFVRYWHDGLALLRLLLVNVVPYRRLQRHFERHPPACSTADAHVAVVDDRLLVTLTGTAIFTSLEPIRHAFARCATDPRPLTIECSGIERIDAALIGQLLLLRKHRRKVGAKLRIVGFNPECRQVIRYAMADHLLDA